MGKKLFSIIFIGLLCICCKSEEKRGAVSEPESSEAMVQQDKEAAKEKTAAREATSVAPGKVIQQDNVTLKVYDYKGFEGFLNRKDGTTYVINFWATWCKPCIEELPYFEKLNETYKDKNVKVLLVSLDMPRMVEDQLIPFIKNKKLQSEVILLDDPKQNTWIPKIDESWSGAIPATIIYNAEERAFFEQSFTYEELEKQVLNFLN